jgi:hypothetical protein
MTKTYQITGSFQDWMATHRYVIYEDILNNCEEGLQEGSTQVLVANIMGLNGSMLFTLPTPTSIVESLAKCEKAFVLSEDYEKAARARDCGLEWSQREKIYKENRTL